MDLYVAGTVFFGIVLHSVVLLEGGSLVCR
jgi:hypothetical protein